MKFIIKPYVGALPIKFGMTKDELVAFIPEIASKDIVTFGECQVNVLDFLKLAFKNGKVTEIEFYTGYNDHQTGELNELEPNLELELDFPPLNPNLLVEDDALDQINNHLKASYTLTIWIYKDLGISFCGYDRSLDYRSFCIFAKEILPLQLEDTTEPPASTKVRPPTRK
jgi:hypothetical protein